MSLLITVKPLNNLNFLTNELTMGKRLDESGTQHLLYYVLVKLAKITCA